MAGETGDRVNFVDNERLDKDDAVSMQTLGQDAQTRMLGALFGTAGSLTNLYGGVLEGVSTTWDVGLSSLTIGPGLFLDSQLGTSPSNGTVARVVRHDPTAAGQNSVVDLTAQAFGSLECIIWGRRTEINGPLATRKQWSVGDAAEKNVSLAPTLVERVEFTVRSAAFTGSTPTSYTDPGAGWFPVVGIRGWDAGPTAPFVVILGAWDAYRDGGVHLGDVGSTRLATAGLLADGVSMGLARLLKLLRASVASITAQDGTVNWVTQGVTPVYRGLKELDADLSAVEAKIASPIQKRVILGCALYKDDTGVSGDYLRYDYPAGSPVVSSNDVLPISFTPTGAGDFTIPLSGIPAGWVVKFAQCSTADNARIFGFAVDATHVDVNVFADADGGTPYNPTYFEVLVVGFKT